MSDNLARPRRRLHPLPAGIMLASALLLTSDWAAWAQEKGGVPADEAVTPSEANPPEEPTIAYEPSVAPSGDSALDASLQHASTLFLLKDRAPATVLGLIARAQRDQTSVTAALRSEGYYDGTIAVTVDGQPADMQGLADRLNARPKDGPAVPVVITAQKGAQYKIEQVSLLLPDAAPGIPPGTREAEQLALDGVRGKVTIPEPGSPARAEPVLAVAGSAVGALKDAGHPFAAVVGQNAEIDPARKVLTVRLMVSPGPYARYGVPVVTGETQVKPSLTSAVTRDLADKPTAPKTQEETRRKLLALGVFDAVRARAADKLDSDGRLPVTFDVSDRARRAIGASAAYETRYGPSLSAYWEHRNLFGGAEKLRLSAEVSRLGVSGSTDDMNGKVGINLRKPWIGGHDVTMVIDLTGVRERLDAYDRDAVIASVQFERQLIPHLTVSAGPFAEFSRITDDGMTNNYQLFGVNGALRWDNTDSLLDPSRGFRANLALSPTWNQGEGNYFIRGKAVASTYFDLSGEKNTIIALRGALGSVLGADIGTVPADRRFYAGGGGSVRGYDYQSIGPRDRFDDPTGGFSVMETSVELRQHVTGPWGMVAFLDGGGVSDKRLPQPSKLSWGAGLGVRYATSIGPIRADVAVPLDKQSGDSGFGLYIGIGQAF